MLLAANVGLGVWLWLDWRQPEPQFAPTDPGVARLVLLSEREPADSLARTAELAAAPVGEADLARARCVTIGPFMAMSEARRAIELLTPLVDRVATRVETDRRSRGWSVFLPAPVSREAALGIARTLQQRGVRDYYVVTAGPQQNTISLGLFSARSNAERRLAEVTELGFSAAITERIDEREAVWLDLTPPPNRGVPWRSVLPNLELDERSIPCA